MSKNIFSPIISHSEARRLTALFMDGGTTLAQERLLYRYYSSADVAPDLMEYRDMLLMLGEAAPEEIVPAKKVRRIPAWLGVAASLAVILTLAIAFVVPTHDSAESTYFAEVYGGSYVVRNGKRITDPAEIERQVKMAEQFAIEQDRLIDTYLSAYDDTPNEVIEQTFTSPATRNIVIQALSEQ